MARTKLKRKTKEQLKAAKVKKDKANGKRSKSIDLSSSTSSDDENWEVIKVSRFLVFTILLFWSYNRPVFLR